MNKKLARLLKIIFALMIALTIGSAIQDSFAKGSKLSGEELWVANCNRCHNARTAQEFSDPDWEIIVDHMRVVCGLTGDESERLLKYLQDNN